MSLQFKSRQISSLTVTPRASKDVVSVTHLGQIDACGVVHAVLKRRVVLGNRMIDTYWWRLMGLSVLRLR